MGQDVIQSFKRKKAKLEFLELLDFLDLHLLPEHPEFPVYPAYPASIHEAFQIPKKPLVLFDGAAARRQIATRDERIHA